MADSPDIKYLIALGMIKGIGPRYANLILTEYETAEEVFKESPAILSRIPYVGNALSAGVTSGAALKRAEKEIEYCKKHNIMVIGRDDYEYPAAMRECCDAPFVLYQKGNINLNNIRALSIVGTRHSTSYGSEMIQSIVKQLSESFPDLIIVSGLAYGVDICAHKNAIRNNLNTVAVLAHGLDRIYPGEHLNDAEKIVNKGALLTEYPTGTEPEKGNFLARNRIIAALSVGTLIVESDTKGGAMATARIASSYNREVMALPGRVIDKYSRGCNYLINSGIASLVTSPEDIANVLNWEIKKDVQKSLNFELSQIEKTIIDLMKVNETPLHINIIAEKSNLSVSETAGILIDLEMRNILKHMPGSMYRIRNI